MTEHDFWTVPPGLHISDGSGGSQKPLVVVGNPAVGNTLIYDGTNFVPAVPSEGGSGVQVATVEISSAELLALHTTPKELIAAPGPTERLVPIAVVLRTHPGTAYTVPGGTLFGFILDTTGNQDDFWSNPEAAGPLAGGANDVTLVPGPAINSAVNGDFGKNIGLMLYGPVTGGTRTLSVTVAYLVIA